MNVQWFLASGNEHKAEEFSKLFSPEIIKITASPKKVEVVEDGATFRENALKKAEGFFQALNSPVMADDSGLVVSYLPDELGIHTARFGGDGLVASERNQLLLERMKGVEGQTRQAYFICVLCFYISPKEIFFFEGRCNGQIAHEERGDKGFGYDPVFIPDGVDGELTLAELPEWKNENSHRAIACREAFKFFKERVGQN